MRQAKIYYDNLLAGILTETDDGDYTYQYEKDYISNHPKQFITFTMPVNSTAYISNRLFPFFGMNRVQMVAADDVARAAVLAASAKDAAGLIVNIGSDPAGVPSVRAQVEALIRYAGSRSRVTAIPAMLLRNAARVLDVFGISPIVPEHYQLADRNFVLDISRARTRLGWEPKGDNVKITCDAYDWYRQNWQKVAPKPNPALRFLEAIT